MNKEESLRGIGGDVKYENTKPEYSSALERLTRRVVELEEKLEELKNKL